MYYLTELGAYKSRIVVVGKDRDIRQVVIRRSVTAEAHVRSQASPSEIFGGQSGNGTGFSPSTSTFPRQYHSTIAPYSSSSARYSCNKDKLAKFGKLPKSNDVSEIGKHWIESYFNFFNACKH
jgi:hypothetical protein